MSIIRAIVTDLAEVASMSPSAIEDIQVAVSEACTNVVRHAYAGNEQAEESDLFVRCSADGGQVTAEVIDRGCGFRDRGGRDRRRDDGGFGLMLIHRLMDQVQLSSTPGLGTMIRMVKYAER